ncbi:MAG: Gfo/Idh/MocA family oxidoreductase [Chitinophagales bacterium]
MPHKKLNVALIGYGYWGKNLLRNLVQHPDIHQTYLCDQNESAIKLALKTYPTLITSKDYKDFLLNEKIDAFVIATPTSSHYQIAKAALEHGKHVLVEKPFVTSVKEAQELCKLAKAKEKIIMVDHVFMYNPVVIKLKEFVTEQQLGQMNYIDSTRINLGIYQNDTNVLWDLACHDLSIINYLIDEKPLAVRAIGRVHPAQGFEDLAYLFLKYKSGMLVQINTSWASPVKIRKMLIGGERKLIVYDDIEPTHKLVIYDYKNQIKHSDSKESKLIDYRLGNATIPKYELTEPLKNVMDAFVKSIHTGNPPLSSGENALEIINVLEKAEISLNSNSDLIPLH